MFLILDGNNLAWAGFHALRRSMGAETPEQKVRAALLGLAGSVLGLVARGGEGTDVPPNPGALSRVALVFDEGRPLRRRAIFPAYQTGREADPNFMDNEGFVLDGVRQFCDFAACTTIEVVRGVNTEADDLIAALTLQSEADRVRIASTDRDFLQLVDERVSIWSPVKRVLITAENFEEQAAPKESSGTPVTFPRERYLDYRAMSGDASDNLPGIPGVGAITAARLLAKAPLEHYLEAKTAVPLRAALGRKVRALEEAFLMGEAKEVVERNRMLRDLRLAAKNYPGLDDYTKRGAWDEATCRAWVKDQHITVLDVEATCRALSVMA
jgi:5'-3' exonuclease